MTQEITNRQDVYTRITNQIVEQLEKGIRPWVKPWNAERAAGRITRPFLVSRARQGAGIAAGNRLVYRFFYFLESPPVVPRRQCVAALAIVFVAI